MSRLLTSRAFSSKLSQEGGVGDTNCHWKAELSIPRFRASSRTRLGADDSVASIRTATPALSSVTALLVFPVPAPPIRSVDGGRSDTFPVIDTFSVIE